MADGTLKVGTITNSQGSGNITIGSGVTVNVNRPAFFAYLSANQSIGNDAYTLAQLNSELWDTDSTFNTSTYKFTVPSGGAGKYYFSTRVKFSGIDDGEQIRSVLYKNGAIEYFTMDESFSSASDQQITVMTSVVLDLAVSDYIQLYVRQNEGAARELFGTTGDGSFLTGYKLGA